MKHLVFMPWYNVVEEVKIGHFTLHPFYLKKDNPKLNHIEANTKIILKSYLQYAYSTTLAEQKRPELKIEHATVITSSKQELNFSEVEVLQYISSFSGVCLRKFTDEHRYLCTDNFKVVIQKVPKMMTDPFDPFTGTRRKYGEDGVGYSQGLFREVKPTHVVNQKLYANLEYRLKFDSGVADCLWKKFYKGSGERVKCWDNNLYPALFSFYQGNTDGAMMQADLIYSQTCIERLFLGQGHTEDSLVEEILKFFQLKGFNFETPPTSKRDWASVTYRKDKADVSSTSIFEAWIRELTRIRNRFAHGNHGAKGNWIWTFSEHLLLASFIFPRLLKLYISRFDATVTYEIPHLDLAELRSFEKLLSLDKGTFFEEPEELGGYSRWGHVLSEAFWGATVNELSAELGWE